MLAFRSALQKAPKSVFSNQVAKTALRAYNGKAKFYETVEKELQGIDEAGTYKKERVITSMQSSSIHVTGRNEDVLNFCANNYLGLANHPEIIDAGVKTLKDHGAGMASVRFICGTQDIHKALELQVSNFFGKEDTILFPSCFDANAGLFEALLSDKDAVISDELNHASVIDGIRLCKAARYRFRHMDMNDLEDQLKAADSKGARNKMVVTDGVFSMDGDIAPLKDIASLCKKHGAILVIDECHATGFFGATGRGTAEYFDVLDDVDIINSTFGKALGGASGGFTCANKKVVDLLRQRARPYLFSNTIAPAVVACSARAIELVDESPALLQQLNTNMKLFRSRMSEAGFTLKGKDHPIVPVMLGDARLASEFADEMLQEGIYVIGFSYPVVPKGLARIRVQLSAAHSTEQVNRCVDAFITVGKRKGVL